MLRTKPIATLSRSARSFFLSGSRCTGAEGSSCSCTDDETCVSRKQRRCNEVLPSQNTSTLATKCLFGIIPRTQHSECQTGSKAPERAGSLLSGDAAGTVGCHNKDSSFSTYFSQKDISDHFVKAGIAAFVFLSDLVNYKLPISDGNGVLFSTQNCMVDATGPTSNIRSSNGKPHRRDNSKTHGRVFVETTGGSNSITHNHGPKAKVEKGGSVKGFDRVPNVASNSQETHGVPLDTCDERQSAPHRIKTKLNHSFTKSKPDEQTSEAKVQKPLRSNFPIRTTPTARHPINSGQAVERFYHILRQVKWGPAAENALGNLNCTLDAYQANQILKQLQDHSVALNFFYWLKRQRGFKHDGHSYTTMIGILGRARQFGAIDRLLDEMVRDGCEPNVVTYNRLIHSYGRANYLDEAVRVFYRMQGVGCKPDRVTYCTLIDIHAKAGFLDIAMDMYRRMQVAGLSPDTFTYSVIINCLGKGGHLASAYKLFCEMISMGCVPNLVTYNIMIALQAKARNYPCALKLYRDMQNAGFQPDKVTYSIVMEVLGHCGYLDEVEALFAEMKCKNWVPDEHVYGLLVDLWGKAGNVPKAREWYQAMLNAGLCPNVPTCNSLLSAFLRVHYFSDAYNVLQSMLQLGLQPSLQTYTLLLSCCTDTQSLRDMVFCGELMAITGHPAHAFLLSMPASGLDGQNVRDHANTFLDLMHSEDRESKRGLVDAVIDFLHKSGLKEEAGSVWEVAAQKNVYPDAVREKSSCYWLINLHVMSDGTAVTALSRTFAWFRRQMLLSGKGPSRIDIVTGWGRRSRVTGSSLVRQAVQELLHIFRFPFYTENGNSGCFVGCGESLNQWLLQSYVERMHLL